MKRQNRCDACNRMFNDGDKVTVVIPDVEITNRYQKGSSSIRLKLSPDAVDARATKVYCSNCLNYSDSLIILLIR